MSFESPESARDFKRIGDVTVNGIKLEIGLSSDSKRVIAVNGRTDLTLFRVEDNIDPHTHKHVLGLVPDQTNAEIAKLVRQDSCFAGIATMISDELYGEEEGLNRSTTSSGRIEVPPGRFDDSGF